MVAINMPFAQPSSPRKTYLAIRTKALFSSISYYKSSNLPFQILTHTFLAVKKLKFSKAT